MTTTTQIHINDLETAKKIARESPTELISAIENASLTNRLKLYQLMGELTEFGLELGDSDRDSRIDGQALETVQTMAEMIDQMLKDWVSLPNWY